MRPISWTPIKATMFLCRATLPLRYFHWWISNFSTEFRPLRQMSGLTAAPKIQISRRLCIWMNFWRKKIAPLDPSTRFNAMNETCFIFSVSVVWCSRYDHQRVKQRLSHRPAQKRSGHGRIGNRPPAGDLIFSSFSPHRHALMIYCFIIFWPSTSFRHFFFFFFFFKEFSPKFIQCRPVQRWTFIHLCPAAGDVMLVCGSTFRLSTWLSDQSVDWANFLLAPNLKAERNCRYFLRIFC